jgi:hypothetical protein
MVALRDRAQQEPAAPATVLLREDACAVLVAKFGQGRAVLRLTFGCAGTNRHDVKECKSLTAKVEPTTLAPRHAWLSVTVDTKR